jgi:tRNA dimethylallyltransferase
MLSDAAVIDTLVLVGPTAIGKSSLALRLAQRWGAVIVSADSQLVYQGLNIGTAKPTLQEQALVPHYLMDLVPPTSTYSAALYKSEALQTLAALRKEGRKVIVVGGTGFYLRQLFEVSSLPEVPPNPAFRKQLELWASAQPAGALYERLKQLDPVRAKQLYPQDTPRLLRALEIIEATGQPVPALTFQAHPPTGVLWRGLYPQNREALWQCIEQRVQAMLESGWQQEAEALAQQHGAAAHALQVAHGYPELLAVSRGEMPLAAAQTQIVTKVRQYSRRQWTWFSKHPWLQWLILNDTLSLDEAEMSLCKELGL